MKTTRYRRLLAAVGAVALASSAFTALTAAPSSAAVIGSLTINPATGSDDTPLSVTTSAGCPSGATNYTVRIFGSGFPSQGQTVVGNSDAGISTSTPFQVAISDTLRTFAAQQSPPATLNGAYTLDLKCQDAFGDTNFGNFTGQLFFTSPTQYTTTPPSTVDGATYTPVTPKRLLNTRTSSKVPALGTVVLSVTGGTTTVPVGATAVALNVTALGTPAASGGKGGFLSVGPAKTTTSSNLNYVAGQVIPNLVISRVSSAGTVTIYNGGVSPVDVLADIQGYFTDDTTGTTYSALAPKRLLNTRSTMKVPALGTVVLAVTGGTTTVPVGATAVALNVTALGTPAASGGKGGFLSVGPAKTTTASNVNYLAGQTIPNLVISKVSAAGTVTIYNGGVSPVDVLADLQGYFGPGIDTSGYESLVPKRLLDTRRTTRIPAASSRAVTVTGGSTTVPSSVAAVALNVTVLSPTSALGGRAGFLSVAPATSTKTSNLNYVAGQTIPNLVISKVSPTGTVTVYNGGSGPVDVLADVQGYFTVAP